ncbi:hypothetical protein Tco_1493797 [Tanacetum coccineum]
MDELSMLIVSALQAPLKISFFFHLKTCCKNGIRIHLSSLGGLYQSARMPIQHAPHAAPSSRVSVHVAVTTITVVEVLRRSSNQLVKYHANMLNMVVKRQSLTMNRSSTKKIVHVPPHAFALTNIMFLFRFIRESVPSL